MGNELAIIIWDSYLVFYFVAAFRYFCHSQSYIQIKTIIQYLPYKNEHCNNPQNGV